MSIVPEISSREELRAFLALNGRMTVDRVPARDVERQENTVLRALSLLREQPGVVLADEVGMGKTFEALGVAAAFHHAVPRSRIVVLTPGPDLNGKWANEIAKFSNRSEHEQPLRIYDFGEDVPAVRTLGGLLRRLREGVRLVVAPVTAFQGARAQDSQEYLLNLYFHWNKEMHGQTANAILRRFRDGRLARIDPREQAFLGVVPFDEVAPHLDAVFDHRVRKNEPPGLHHLYGELGYEAFENEQAVRRAIDQARFRLVRELIPELSLLIIDEAHKLKNAHTVRTRAVRTVFRRRFRKALFLTATPFQLDISELRQVFTLFANAKGAPPSVKADADQLFADIRVYQTAYDHFQQAWAGLDHATAELLREHLDEQAELTRPLEDPSLTAVFERFQGLLALKEQRIEPALRRWMIRSLREDKRSYRNREKKSLSPRGSDDLPFFLYERLIAELFRVKSPTHKAAVQINMVSSYAAARAGALLSSEARSQEQPTVEAYRRLLVDVLDRLAGDGGQHPKLDHVVGQALLAAANGEKTLVFCARVQTLKALARELDGEWHARLLARWQVLYPGAVEEDIFDRRGEDDKVKKGKHAILQQRFHSGHDMLYLALRERYVQDVLHLHDWPLAHLDAIVEEANRILQTVETGQSAAARLHYRLAKRCVEQATARLCARLAPTEVGDYEDAVARLCDPRFVLHGYDLEPDDQEGDETGHHRPSWHISREVAELVVQPRPHLWGVLGRCVFGMPERTRIDVVERLARYLTVRQVPFLVEVLEAASAQGLSLDPIESRPLLELIDRYWLTPPGRQWIDRFVTFLDHYSYAPEALRLDLLNAIDRAAFARHTGDGESREKLREAFNTPLFPMVLIANEVMQEGLDLHQHCRRVVHHDLAWNPAQLEQRVGRVDRLGSLTARLRAKDPTATLDILYPLVKNTIDDRLYRTVHAREKWLEFLLGARPDLEEYGLGENEPPLPDGMAERLRIELGPR
jgi:superfamily II DNA or RNA helicase